MMLCAATNLAAQDEALTKTVEVSRAYEPTIPEAYKINSIPRIDDTATVSAKFTYPLRQVKPLTEEYLINPIAPARVQRERYDASDERNRGYVRAGFGIKTTTLFDAYYGSERAQKFVWDVFANHYANHGDVKMKDEPKEKVPNLNMRNEIGASGQYNFKRGLLYGKAGFHRRDVRFYGYDTAFTLSDYNALTADEARQAYNHTYATLSYKSYNLPNETWTLGGKFNYYNYHSRKQLQNENALEFNLYATKRIFPTTTVGLTVNTDVYLRNEKLNALNNNTVVSIMPEATEKRDWWEASAKLNLTLDNFSGKVKPYFFPVLNFTAFITEEIFFPYVEVSGDYSVNTYKSLSIENPYLAPIITLNLQNTYKPISFKGGMKGHAGSMFAYDLNLSYSFVHDMHFFVTDPLVGINTSTVPPMVFPVGIGNYFSVVYDDVKVFNVSGAMRFQPSRALEFKYFVSYDKYYMDKLPAAYNRPAFNTKLEARYNLWNKLTTYASGSVIGGYQMRSSYISGSMMDYEMFVINVERKAGYDLSFGAEYSFFDRSSAFLQLNNVTNNHYHVYNNYPTYGFNIMVGYTCMF